MLIATWNVNSLSARLPRLLSWLETRQPDVVCLQETKLETDAFPYAAIEAAGYEVVHRGQPKWNGVAILSRVGLLDVETDMPGAPGFPEAEGPPEARYIAATCGGVRVVGVYVPNGRNVGDPHYVYKLAWFEALREHIASLSAGPVPFAILGDFNVAPNDDDVWDIADFAESTHVTAPERAALSALRETGLTDVLPTIAKGAPFTFWDYRGGNFHKGLGMRIDLIYANAAFERLVEEAWIDREARKAGRAGTPAPSDHAPVLVRIGESG